MRLAFIYPPYQEIRNQPSIKEVSRNYGIYPPINLAYVAAVARHFGHEVYLIDANAEFFDKKEALSILKKQKPDALLFTITTYLFHQTLEWIRYFKKHLDCKVIVGGVHVGLYPKETLSHEEIDIAILGDSEETLPIALDALGSGSSLKKVKNICFREKGKVILTGSGKYSDFIEGVYPARDLLPNHKYYEFISQRRNFTGIITSRGCPFRCACCEQGSKNYMWNRNVPDVLNEIKECYHTYGIREIDFFDPIFSLNRKRTMQLTRGIARLNLDLQYAVRTRVDCVDDEILKSLKKSGCKRIYYGIESSSPEILKRLNKNTNINQIKKALRLTKKHNIDAFGYFMLGNDGETPKTMEDTIKFSLSLPLDYAQYNKTVALAGTEMYEKLKKKIGYDFWARYTLEDHEPDWIVPKIGTTLSDDEIEKQIARAYKRFYFRPKIVMGRIMKLRSFPEFLRYSKAAISFLH